MCAVTVPQIIACGVNLKQKWSKFTVVPLYPTPPPPKKKKKPFD